MKISPLLIIFLVVFIDLLGFGIVIPILPYYAESFGASAVELGWLMMIYSAMQLLFAPFWGRISDKFGRRPVLLVGISGVGISMLILGLAQSFFWLFLARLLAGFFAANISAASAYIADITTKENRAKGMGLIGAAFGLGFLFGPAIGGVLAKFGYGTAAFVAASLSFLNLLFAFFKLKEPNLDLQTRQSHRNRLTKNFLLETLNNPQKFLVILIFFLSTLGMAQLETSFALYLLAKFNLGAFEAGMILALMAFVMALIQGGGIGILVKKFGEKKLLMAGTLLMTISLSGAVHMITIIGLVGFILLHAVGYALTSPSLMSLISRHTDEHTQGGTMGVYHSAGSLGRILGPLLAGFLFDYSGMQFPFYVASVFFFLGFLIVALKGDIWLVNN